MNTENRLILENDKCIFYENSFTDTANTDLISKGLKYKCFYAKLKNKNVCNYILVNSKGVVAYETGLYESLGNMIDMLAFDKEYSK